jgi:hypothetical protein
MICLYASFIWKGPLPTATENMWKITKKLPSGSYRTKPNMRHVDFNSKLGWRKLIGKWEYIFFYSCNQNASSDFNICVGLDRISDLNSLLKDLVSGVNSNGFYCGYAGFGPSPVPPYTYFGGERTLDDNNLVFDMVNPPPVKNNWMAHTAQEEFFSRNMIRNIYPKVLVNREIFAKMEPFLSQLLEMGVSISTLDAVTIFSFPKETKQAAFDLLFNAGIIVEARAEPDRFFSEAPRLMI